MVEPTAHIDSVLRGGLMNSASALLAERSKHVSAIAEIDAKLAAIETLTGEKLRPGEEVGAVAVNAPPTDQEAKEPLSWKGFITDTLSAVQGGLTGKQLLASIKASPEFALRFARSPNSYYNALQRLQLDKTITKRDQFTYLTATLRKIDAGELDDKSVNDESGGMPALVQRVLDASPVSMTAAEVLFALRAIPEAREKMEANRQIAYATLSRMVSIGLISKDDSGRYRIRDDQEAPNRALRLVQEGSDGVR